MKRPKPPPFCSYVNTAPACCERRTAPRALSCHAGTAFGALPSHTRRSEESDEFQQFSTPLGLGFLMILPRKLSPRGTPVLEPSAGTGLLAIHAEVAGAALALNELAEARHAILSGLFPKSPVTRFNAEQIGDYLGAGASRPRPYVIEPALLGFAQHRPHDARRDRPAYPLGAPPPAQGGRLVALAQQLARSSGERTSPDFTAISGSTSAFAFTATVDGRIYARHGTSVDTRLTVIDRIAPADAASPRVMREPSPNCSPLSNAAATARPFPGIARDAVFGGVAPALRAKPVPRASAPLPAASTADAAELAYEARELSGPAAQFNDRIYEPYEFKASSSPEPSRIRRNSCNRPPWHPSARPFLPTGPCSHAGW